MILLQALSVAFLSESDADDALPARYLLRFWAKVTRMMLFQALSAAFLSKIDADDALPARYLLRF